MKTRKIRGGLFGIETKKQMECLKNIIIVILSAEASYIKENSQANDSFFKKRIDELNKQSRELKTLIDNSSNKSYFTNKFKGMFGNKQLTDYEIKRNEMIDILVELIEGIGLNGQEQTTDQNLLKIFYYFRDLIELLTCIKTHNNNHNCGTGYKNVYEYLKRYYCGSSNLSTINNYVKTILRTQPLETNISCVSSSITQLLKMDDNSPDSSSYKSANSSKSSSSYHSAKSSSVASGNRKPRKKSKKSKRS